MSITRISNFETRDEDDADQISSAVLRVEGLFYCFGCTQTTVFQNAFFDVSCATHKTV